MVTFDGETWGKSFEKVVRTAESLHTTQRIGDSAVERIIGAIEEGKQKLDFHAHDVIGVTTAAMRLAQNRTEVLEIIFRRTGVVFTLIDGEKEAALTLMAVRYRLMQMGRLPSRFLLSDIGGGSTEFVESKEGSCRSVSFNIGIVTLSESATQESERNKKLASFVSDIRSFADPHGGDLLVLTAGTPTTIAAYLSGMDYDHYDPERINGFKLRLKDCHRVYQELLDMDEATRIRYVGVGREQLIATGILMVIAIYSALNIQEAVVVDDGLREGVALNYYAQSCHIF
jgi:exopolyphosphatase/guanosine-5'-triphosphate,3'-diphosphate pyrophosphatase